MTVGVVEGLTGVQVIQPTQYTITMAEAAAAETAAEGAEALAMTENTSTAESGDWIYSATAEGRTGEVAVNGIDLDGEPGLIYSGPEGGAVSVLVDGLDISEGTIAPEATDTVTVGVFLNNTLVATANEGFVALTGEATHEMNVETYVGGLTAGDVLRVGLIGGGEETVDTDVTPGNVKIK